MRTLSLPDVKVVVAAAWEHYRVQDPTEFEIMVNGNRIIVTIELRGSSFDCGMPGYRMANADVPGLGLWVPGAIRINDTRGYLAPCQNFGATAKVNVQYDKAVLFNFHVNLEDPC